MPAGYIIAEDQYLGTFRYASQAADSWGWMSRAYFCSTCGEIWARTIIQDKQGNPHPFRIANVACRQHWDPWTIPGSLLVGELAYNLNELSPEAIQREFDIHLNYFEAAI